LRRANINKMPKLICVKTYPSRMDAELARGYLGESGIRAIVSADDEGGMHAPLMLVTGGARLLVLERDKEKALAILEALESES